MKILQKINNLEAEESVKQAGNVNFCLLAYEKV